MGGESPSGTVLCEPGKALDKQPPLMLAKKKPDRKSRYQWLFGKKRESDPRIPANAKVLEGFDREIKQARKLYLSGETDKAVLKYRSAIDRFESLVDAIPNGSALVHEMDRRFRVYDELATKILGPVEREPKESLARSIFYLMEKRRLCRRNLILKKAGVLGFFDVPRSLLKEEARILKELEEIRGRGALRPDRPGEETLKQRLAEVRRSLQKSSPRYALFRRGLPVPLGEVRRDLLKRDEMILDFNIFRDRMVVGLISTERAVYHQIQVNESEIDKGVFKLQEKLREFTSSGRSTFMGHAWKEPCRRIHRTLLGRLPPLPALKTTIFVIPDRSLWYLPMSVLLDEEDRPFGRDRLVSMIPSADMLRFIRSADDRKQPGGRTPALTLFESLPWVSDDDARKAARRKSTGKKRTGETTELARIERLILSNPVYPKPSEIVLKMQKLFKKSDVRVGPAATSDHLFNTKEHGADLTVLAVPLALTDTVGIEHQPCFFFSPDKRGRRRLNVGRLFEIPMESRLMVLPTCWFHAPEKETPLGEGPLLLSTALFYSGVPVTLLDYSNPGWGSDDPFLLTVFKKVAQGVPPGKALADYARRMPAGLDSSFSGKPPAWSGWIVLGDPLQ